MFSSEKTPLNGTWQTVRLHTLLGVFDLNDLCQTAWKQLPEQTKPQKSQTWKCLWSRSRSKKMLFPLGFLHYIAPAKAASQNTDSENHQITNPKLCHAPTTIHLTKNHVKTKTRQKTLLITNCCCARHAEFKSALINQNRASNRKLRQTKPRHLRKALTKNLEK